MTGITPHNAFTPAMEVQDIDRFAGRGKEIDALSHALQSEGSQLVLYGQRGIGKSSLAKVLVRLSVNEMEVLSRLSIKPLVQFDYLPIYFSCDDSVSSIDKLLLRLLTDENALAPWVPFKVVERSTTVEGGGKLGIKVIEFSGSGSKAITERAVEFDSDVFSTFVNACKSIVKSGVAKNGLLLVIDEFDRIRDRSGIASLLKSLGSERVTFALVGVATTIRDLIAEHESVARQLADGAVHVDPMSDVELREIIARAMTAMGGMYSFEGSATDWIVSVARGHAFYVHLLGKHALLSAIASGSSVVTLENAQEAMAEIALKGSAPIQEGLYKTAVGHSFVREFVLKRFAQQEDEEIHTTALYAGIAKELRIDSSAVSVYVGQLASEKYGSVLVKSRDRYYRFPDSLFKAYAAARPYERAAGDREDDV